MPGNTAPALAAEYSGRTNVVVFDFTDQASTSAIEASPAGESVL
jgi:hypothetical protein